MWPLRPTTAFLLPLLLVVASRASPSSEPIVPGFNIFRKVCSPLLRGCSVVGCCCCLPACGSRPTGGLSLPAACTLRMVCISLTTEHCCKAGIVLGFVPDDRVRDAAPSVGLRVIGAGLPRTGTASLRVALEALGLRSYHMEEVITGGGTVGLF